MKNIDPRPYQIFGKIQHYDWGTKNENAFIPKLLNTGFQAELPYAEYWIGNHPKAPSDVQIDGNKYSLAELLEKFSAEILGRRVSAKYGDDLPFLFKVLSIGKALSIQAHPDKNLAAELNKKDPDNYPDRNHKPEIAIAVDKLDAIVGLKNPTYFRQTLEKYPEVKNLYFAESKEYSDEISFDDSSAKKIYTEIMNAPSDKLNKSINSLLKRFTDSSDLDKCEKEFLIQYENYGIDVGLISILLFNYISLKPGEAIFTEAGVPHAYLSGNIVECMANSDNVVRAGLTPKYKDVDTLNKMLRISSNQPKVETSENSGITIFKTPAEEFEIQRFKSNKVFNFKYKNDLRIVFILQGEIDIYWDKSSQQRYFAGQSILIPAILGHYSIKTAGDSIVYSAVVPG